MGNTVYSIGPQLTTTRDVASQLGKPFCLVQYGTASPKLRTVLVPDATTSKSLVKGNHVTALPYTATFIEVEPINGSVATHVELWNRSPANPVPAICGKVPDVERRWAGQAGHLVSLTNLTAPPTMPSDVKAFLIGIANTKANADLRRALVNLPLLVAERRQTASYLLGKAKFISEAASAVQRRDLRRYFAAKPRDRRRVSKDIADEHLGFVFGLLPLIDEIHGAVQLYEQAETLILSGRGRMAKEAKANSDLSVMPGSYSSITAAYASAFQASRERITRFSVRTSLSVDVSLSSAQFARNVGFNPLAAFYDLVPLSFLSDFVSNLGTFIRALDPLVGIQFRTGCISTWEETKEIVQLQGRSVSATEGTLLATIATDGYARGAVRALRVTRTPLTGFPSNELHFVNNMSWGKAFVGLSLAVQRYVKPLRSLIRVKQFRYKGVRPKYLPPINYR